jgi:alkylhydroperoxidase family enzyme
LLQDESLVAGVLADLETSALPEKEKALLRFVDKVNHESPNITANDIEGLHSAGWEDSAIYDAITVCALFNFYNRWIDATGVHPMSDEAHRKFGEGTARNGYIHRL